VIVWDAGSGAEVAVFGPEEHEGWVKAVAWHPGTVGWLLSFCEDRCVRVLDAVSKSAVRRIPHAAADMLTCAALRSPGVSGGPVLLTAAADATIQVWECR
jgi:WD40 repeat protein